MKAIFLDRDGILNEAVIRNGKPFAAVSAETCKIIEGVPERLKLLKQKGFSLIVITNQPDAARGDADIKTIEAINQKIKAAIPEIDEIKVCFHTDEDDCLCRKPKPGMIIEAAFEYHIDLENSFVVGDRWRDVDAAHAAGCKSLFVDYGYDEKLKSKPDHTFKHPTEALDWILSKV